MKSILVVSVPNHSKGGVASVVSTFMSNKFINEKYNMVYYFSHETGGFFTKHLSFLILFFKFPVFLWLNKFNGAHVHGSLKGSFFRKTFFLFWLKIYNIPVIYQCHAAQVDSFLSNEIKKRLVNKIFQQYDLRLCLGNFWKDKFEKITKLEWNVLPNPVAKFSFDKIEHDSFNLLFMGELSNRKGIKDLIQAFVLVKHENAKLYIAGNGDIKHLMELCNKLGINERVEFLGWIDSIKKSDLLSIADVVILPSYAEGLPISVLEAMSANIAVIATPVGAVSDAITHNVNGLLVTPGKIGELADAINDLGYDKEKRQKFAELGRKKFNESFHEDIVAHKILEFYDRLTNECGVSK